MKIQIKSHPKISRFYLLKSQNTFRNQRKIRDVGPPNKKNSSKVFKKKKTIQKPIPKTMRHESVLTSQNSNFLLNMETLRKDSFSNKQLNTPLEGSAEIYPAFTQENQREMLVCEKNQKHSQIFEYSLDEEIIKHLMKTEEAYVPKLMLKSGGCTEINRISLVKWIFQLCKQIKFSLETTVFLAINVIDRAFGQFEFTPQQLPLLGITSLFMAGKFEEINYPSLEKFLKALPNKYQITKQLVLELQSELLHVFSFSLNYPSPASFMKYICINLCSSFHELSLKVISQLILKDQSRYLKPSQICFKAISIMIDHRISIGDTQEQDLQIKMISESWRKFKNRFNLAL